MNIQSSWRLRSFAISALLLACELVAASPAVPILHVLILSGQNNHAWRETTPKLKAILESSGNCAVDITEHPEQVDASGLSKYNVLLSNWNTFGNPAITNWPAKTREAFLDFVRSGKGFVSVHSGSSSFYDWPEFQRISGGSWRLRQTGHGPIHRFTVRSLGQDHPITRGVTEFLTTDELWYRTGLETNIQILATAFSATNKLGSGRDEPIAFTTIFGQGRGFNLLLGHDANAMESPGFQLLLKRGVEWAGTGFVQESTLGMISSGALNIQSTQATFDHQGKLLWKWFADPTQGKPFFHPVATTDGTTLTALRPADHPWHRGLWWSWKFINGVNYWEEDKETGLSAGITEILSHLSRETSEGGVEIVLVLSYHAPGQPSILREHRFLKISLPDAAGDYWMDWRAEFIAGDNAVQFDRTPISGEPGGARWGGYAGLSARLDPGFRQAVFRNSEGQLGAESTHGRVARWMDVWDSRGGMTIFDHPSNLRYPTPWYVDSKMPYLSPALLFNAPHTLQPRETLVLRYRILIHARPKTPSELESSWQEFCRASLPTHTRANSK